MTIHSPSERKTPEYINAARPTRMAPSYREYPETGAIKCDAVHCGQMSQDAPMQTHVLVVADGTDGAEVLHSGQLPRSVYFHC